jgi:hypothetical protein
MTCLWFGRSSGASVALAILSVCAGPLAPVAVHATDLAPSAFRTFAQPMIAPPTAEADAPAARAPDPQPLLRPSQVETAVQPVAPIRDRSAQPHGMPRLLPLTRPQAPHPVAAADTYSPQEIASARVVCADLLRGLDVVVIEEEPIKAGSCGAPAPVQLISVGRNPQVAVSPPVTMTCEMVAAVHRWVSKDLQPAARRHLASPIIAIDTMSSYSCRNAYGRKRGNLSEHGRANAMDIRGFQTADARETSVLAHWGPTGWEIRAQVAAAANKAAADRLAAEKPAKAQPTAVAKSPAPAQTVPKSEAPVLAASAGAPVAAPNLTKLIEAVPAVASRLPGAAPAAEGRTGYGWDLPSRLGGPKVAQKAAPIVTSSTAPVLPPGPDPRRALFLREAHASACRIFGTTLGPESNLAHRNHFHVDMADRASGKNYCE